MKQRIFKIISILLVTIMAFSLVGCKASEEESFKAAKISELNGQVVAVITGSVGDKLCQDQLPLSKIDYYTSVGDAITALGERKVDTVIVDSGIATSVIREDNTLTYINESLALTEYGAIFAKDEDGKNKRNDFDAFLRQIEVSGELTYLKNKWLKNDDATEVPYKELDGPNGTFSIAINTNSYPFIYLYNNEIVGYEIELAYLYCKDRGYKLDLNEADFGAILASVTTGKVDAAFSGIIYSDERANNYYFSDLYAQADMVCVIRKENATSKFNNLDDLIGKTLGVVSGGIVDQYAKATINDINIVYFNSTSDMVEALSAEKVDAISLSSSTLSTELKNRVDIKVIGNVGLEECGYLFPKTEQGELLRRELNDFMSEAKENGLLDSLDQKWHSDDESVKDIDYNALTGEKGTLTFAVSSAVGEPAAYYKEDRVIGYDIDFIFEFAKAKGYGLDIIDYSFSGMLEAVAVGKCDIAGSNVTITPERKKSALFSDPLYSAELSVCAYDETVVAKDTNLFNTIKRSIERNFIKENRYLLFIDGTIVTLIISICSILIGLLLGIALFGIETLDNKTINFILSKLANLISETPTVVLLMVFYYVIFNDSSLDSIWISITAFSVYFSFVVSKLLSVCLIAIDKGQFEAAYALGYSKFYTYIRVIVPQLIPMFLPLFSGEVIGLIKATSIVGYIAVQDITKVTDIIRSRTYEAFFPLIVTTIIYIIIIKISKITIKAISRRINYNNRNKNKILVGVKTHD